MTRKGCDIRCLY